MHFGRFKFGSIQIDGATYEFITSSNFHAPTTVAMHGGQLALANSHFDTGIPPTATQFEVVVVDR